MDEKNQKRVEEMRIIIEKSTEEELKNIKIMEYDKATIAQKGKNIYLYVPKEYIHELQLTINETVQLRKSKKEVEDKKRKEEEDLAFELGSSNYKRVSKDVLEKFSPRVETPEERAKRLKFESKRRKAKKRNEKKNIKKTQKRTTNKSFSKTKEKRGKKIRNIMLAMGMSAVAITGAVHGINTIQADAADNKYVESTVVDLNESEITEKTENIIKEGISEGTGENIENIKITSEWRDSSSYVVTVRAGDKEYTYLDDLRGGDVLNQNTLSRNIFNLIREMNNAKGKDRKDVINALKDSMNFSKNNNMVDKAGKLVDVVDDTQNIEKNEEER